MDIITKINMTILLLSSFITFLSRCMMEIDEYREYLYEKIMLISACLCFFTLFTTLIIYVWK